MVTYGDGVADINIHDLVEFHKKQHTVATITGVRPTHRFGLLNIDETAKKVKGFYQHKIVEKGEKPSNDYINGGFMVFNNAVLTQIQEGSMIESLFEPLSEQGQLSVYTHPGKWKCMDTYKEVEEMNEHWNKDPFWKVWKE